MAPGRRHPLLRAVRLGFALLGLTLLGLSAWRAGPELDDLLRGRWWQPPSDEAFRETIAGAFADAVLQDDFDGEIRAALAEDDIDRARVLHGVATTAGRPLSADTAAAYAEATTWWATTRRVAAEAGKGAVTGTVDGVAGLAGALAVDLGVPLVGDARDVAVQLWNRVTGREVDPLILGLAAAGLALPVAQAATDPLKAALRFRRVDPGLASTLRRGGVDVARRAGDDLLGIWRAGGTGAVAASLRQSRRVEDLVAYRRTARLFGKDSEAHIAVLGRRIVRLADAGRHLVPLLAGFGGILSLLAAAGLALLHHGGLRAVRAVTLRLLGRALAPGTQRA
ncbi:MAG: hypothetical protein U1E14_12520 [Geminicoccaceae bacterium]